MRARRKETLLVVTMALTVTVVLAAAWPPAVIPVLGVFAAFVLLRDRPTPRQARMISLEGMTPLRSCEAAYTARATRARR